MAESKDAKSKDDVTMEFDHHIPVAEQDPDDKVDELRAKCPIGWSNQAGGFWYMTRYDDVRSALVEWKTFCSEHGGTSVPGYAIAPSIPLDLNPPEHKPYRQLLNPMLSKEEVANKLQPRVEYWTDHFIDQVIGLGRCDLVHDLAIKVPGAITLEWLGWTRVEEEQDRVCECWHNLVSYPPEHPLITKAYEDIAWLEERIIEELDDREAHPRDDRMTQIGEAEIDGKPIPRDMAVGLIRVAIAGGVDTTGSTIGLALEYLDRQPEHKQQLIDEPSLWETATDEFLRRYGPVRTVGRTVGEDTVWGGCEMKKGERVLVGLKAANLDAEAFPNPREMILDRQPNPHISFGSGFHRCVGMHLARTQFETVMKQLLARMPDYRLRRAEIIPHMAEPQISGWTTLPAEFTPGPKIA